MEVFNIKFVETIEKHPELYNYTLREYSRKDCTEKAWNEVAKEVNRPASECKEKWRNLRSTFVKYLKPKASGSGATKKKPYYLSEVMQFAIPFVKIAATATGNLPAIREEIPVLSPNDLDLANFEESLQPEISQTLHEELPSTGASPQPSPSAKSARQDETPSLIPTVTASGSRGPRGQLAGKRKRHTTESDADKVMAEYFSAKAAKIAIPSVENMRIEGVKNFLNSLIPDLVQMNDVQLRIFKRRSLLLIDEVLLGTCPNISYQPVHETPVLADPPKLDESQRFFENL